MNSGEPYIGVTGFTQRHEAELAVETAGDWRVMIGVLASSRTLQGRVPKKWVKRHPKREEIAGIFPEKSDRTLNLIHLSLGPDDSLLGYMRRAERFGGPNFQGFQLNVPFPDPDAIREWREKRGSLETYIVLQCGPTMLRGVLEEPRLLAQRLVPYAGLVDSILIDASCGENRTLDSLLVARCFDEIISCDWRMGLGTAGGIRPGYVEILLGSLTPHYKFSVDAEGGLRDDQDVLKPTAMVKYIREVQEEFSSK